MSKKFILFGEKIFDIFAREKFSLVAMGIDRMSDVEVLMYRETFDELVEKTMAAYKLPEINVSFENKLVDLIGRPWPDNYTRFFAEYSVVIEGSSVLLELNPYQSGYRPVNLDVEVRGNILAFEIDTNFYHKDLSPVIMEEIKMEYDRIKRFISNSSAALNNNIRFFNKELREFLISQLANKLRNAEKLVKVKNSLNF